MAQNVERAPRGIAGGLFAMLAVACGGGNEDEAGARALLARVQSEQYQSWARAPGWESRQPSVSVHGDTSDIFVNTVVTESLNQSGLTAWPNGAIFVKDSYRSDTFTLIAIMEKRGSDWFYAEFDADGSVKFSGRPEVCLNCHQAGVDFIFSTPFP